MSSLNSPTYDWEKTIYGRVTEEIPNNMITPLGKQIMMTTYVDANLMHDIMDGKSVTGILHFLNKTPIEWFTKKQGSVQTATFGSEFVAARTATEQIIELRYVLRYLGVPIKGPTFLFGDNQSVVGSSSIPHGRLHKRHVILSYHRVREAIAARIIKFLHIYGKSNPADILSKAWGYQQIWDLLRPLLFWEGDTLDLTKNGG
jgi:hypothetical protein